MNLRTSVLSICILLPLLMSSIAYADADTPPGIVVWKLHGNENVKPADVNLISNFVTNQVAKYSGSKVISEADIYTILKGEQTRQRCGAEDTSCVAEIGAALGVPEAISGDIGKMGDYWMLNLRRINVRSAEVIGRSSRNIKGDTNVLIESLSGTVAELFGKETISSVSAPVVNPEPRQKAKVLPPTEPGRMVVQTEPTGTSLFLDGDQKGTTPFEQKMDVGEYKLELKMDGYKTIRGSVAVKSKETTLLDFTLERDYPTNPYKKAGYATFFSGLGVAAILGGVGFVLGSAYADEYRTKSSGSINDLRDQSQTMTGLGYAGVSIGGALMLTGIILWIVSPGDQAWWEEHHVSAVSAADGSGDFISLGGK